MTSTTMPTRSTSPDIPLKAPSGAKRTPWVIRHLKIEAVCAVVVVLGAVGWTAFGARAGNGAELVQSALVSPQTFNVVLKEKGELKAAKSTDVKCEVEGRSTIISLIPEGTAVQKGDLLVTLASDEIENKIRESELKEANAITAHDSAKSELDIQLDKNQSDKRKAELQIELKQLDLNKYVEGDWKQKEKDAEIAIEQAGITLDRRKEDFEAAKQLRDKEYNTQTEFEEAEFNFQKAEWDLEKAILAKQVLIDYTKKSELALKESDFEEAKKEADRVAKNATAEENKKRSNVEGRKKELDLIQDQLAKFRTQKEKCRIVAPTQGFVVYYTGGGGGRFSMNGEGQIKEGAEVFERQVLMQLPDISEMMVTVRIHEAKTDKLKIDQPAAVTVEGMPGRSFPGKVRKIAALADSQNSWLNPDLKEYETEIVLDPTDAPLKPGVTAQAEIMVTTVEDQLAIPVQAIYAKSGKRFVFRQNGKSAEAIPVQVGPVGNEWAAIASGLESGDRVLMAFTDEHRRMIPDAPGGEERAGGMQRRKGPGGPGGARHGGPGGGRPGGAPVKQTSNDSEKPAEVVAKPVEAKESDTAKAPETKPSSSDSGRTSGKTP